LFCKRRSRWTRRVVRLGDEKIFGIGEEVIALFYEQVSCHAPEDIEIEAGGVMSSDVKETARRIRN